jgi:hypothetical protein
VALQIRVGFDRATPVEQATVEAVTEWRAVQALAGRPVGGGEPTVRICDDDPEHAALGEYVVEVTAPGLDPEARPPADKRMGSTGPLGYRFVPAKGFTRGRPDGPPLWMVWHSMESDELPNTAESTAGYFANPGDGRDVSSHWCFDANSAVQCVDEKHSAWTVGNRQGNYRGVNLELAGRARQSEAQWLDKYGLGLFAVAAPVVAASMKRWGIPNRWCSIADLRAGRPGHTTHRDLGVAFGGTDHTDPGAHFPRKHVLEVVQAELGGGLPLATNRDEWNTLMGYDGAVPAPSNWPNEANKELSLASAVQRLLFQAETAAARAATEKARDAATAAWQTKVAAALTSAAADLKVLGGVTANLEKLIRAGGGSAEVAALMGRLDALAAIISAGDQQVIAALRADITRLRAALSDAEQASSDTLDAGPPAVGAT